MVLLVVLGGFGWFWLVPCFSNYTSLEIRAFRPRTVLVPSSKIWIGVCFVRSVGFT